MSKTDRVIDALNKALHEIFENNSEAIMLGEDICDPYGGAFKATRGLSTAFPARVVSTPISEQAIAGIGAGIALEGGLAIVEYMFGDFLPLAFDPILNFATKSFTMYGRRHPIRLIIRTPMGAQRGYGATHSQQLQKHFIGVPNLSLFELSPFHPPAATLKKILALKHPAILFEDKTLYTKRMYSEGHVDEFYSYQFLDSKGHYAHVYCEELEVRDCLLITTGGCFHRCLDAARHLLEQREVIVDIIVADFIYPFDPDPILPLMAKYSQIFIVEEGSAGGTWGAEVSQKLHVRGWRNLRHPIRSISSADSVIPAARHLEASVILNTPRIVAAVEDALNSDM